MKTKTLTQLYEESEFTKELDQEFPWKKKGSRHSLHNICSRICSLPPSIPAYFIENFSEKGDIVFDPFSGKGTVPLEALIRGRLGIGNDISPEAWMLTSAKVDPINPKYLLRKLNQLEKEMGFLPEKIKVDPRVKIFYHKDTLRQIMELRELLKKNTKASRFIKAIALGILHGSTACSLSLKCSHSYSMSPNYVKKYAKEHNLERPIKDVISCIKKKAKDCLKDGRPNIIGESYCDDSRKLSLKSQSVNLIITSPPYFAVQTYAYDNWLRLWFLGYDYKEIRKRLVNTNSEELYGQFMYESFKEMYRVLKPESFCFIVVGDITKTLSKGKKTIKTAEFLLPYAEKVGFKAMGILIDTIPNGKKVFQTFLKSDGIKTERILCLQK